MWNSACFDHRRLTREGARYERVGDSQRARFTLTCPRRVRLTEPALTHPAKSTGGTLVSSTFQFYGPTTGGLDGPPSFLLESDLLESESFLGLSGAGGRTLTGSVVGSSGPWPL